MTKTKILMGIICLAVFAGMAEAQNATVIMTFDDGWYSVLQNAKPIMDKNSQTGVEFIITNQPDLSWNGQSNNYMNVSQLQQLYDSGWDLSSHTNSHTVLTTANTTMLNYELGVSKDWLDNHGFTRGSMFLAYPEGAYNSLVVSVVQTNPYVGARTVDNPNGIYSHYDLTSPDVFMLKSYETIGGIDNDVTVINQINNAVSTNGLLIVSFHKIVDTLSTDETGRETEFLTTDFQNVSTHLKNLSDKGSVIVTTLSGYFGVVPLPRYMPATPANILLTTSLDFSWANASWIPGIGANKTDLYNVYLNGARLDDTVGTFVNISVVPGQTFNLSIIAVNTTNGNTLNPVPIYLNTTIPLLHTYMPDTPVNTTVNNGDVINGRGTILVQWQLGNTTNKTDFYNINVNGVNWINGITNTSYNITGVIPGATYQVKIYAVNTTNGITINQTPAIINATIPLYMPAVPVEISQSYGIFWAYFKWDSGNDSRNTTNSTMYVTDFFNYSVNGVWTNLSTNKSVNVSTEAHTIVNVSVYAYNSSNGGIQNPVSLYMYLQIPDSPIDMSNIWAEYDIYAGDTLRIVPVVYNPDNDTYKFTTNATNASINSTTGEFILNTSKDDIGTHYWNISVNNNHTIRTLDFMVVIVSKPVHTYSGESPSGGGDGGATSVYDPNAEFYERRDSQIRYNTDSTVQFFKNGLVSNMTFHGIRNYGEVAVKVSILKDNPTPKWLNNAYKFFSVTLDVIQQRSEYLYITNTSVTIRINKSNLSDNILKAYRYVNDSWIPVDVEDMSTTDKDAKQFKLKSNGLSNFAIVLEPIEIIKLEMPTNDKNVIITGNEIVDKTIKQIVSESIYRKLINLIKKYMWWI